MIGSTSIITAILTCLFIPLIHIIINNYYLNSIKNYSLIISSLIPYIFWYLLLYYFNNNINRNDILIGIFTILSLTLVYIEFYSMITRGFSLQIMESIKHKPKNIEHIISSYSGNKGPSWLIEKRINGLEVLNLIKRVDNNLIMSNMFTILITLFFILYKNIFNLKKGG